MDVIRTPETASPPQPEPLLTRIWLVLTEPGRAFASIAAAPRWVGAALIVLLAGVITAEVTMPYAMEARREAILSSDRLTAEQAERALNQFSVDDGLVPRLVTGVFAFIGQGLFMLIVAGVLLFGGNFLLGGDSDFRTVLAVTAHAWLVTVVKSVIVVPLMLAKGSMSVATSLQILLPTEQWTTPLGVLLGATDLFSLWMLALLVIGLAAAYSFSRGKVAALVVTFYVLATGVSAGLALLFAGMMPS